MKRTERPVRAVEPAEPAKEQRDPALHQHGSSVPMATPTGIGMDVWLSFILGVVCMLVGKTFAVWALHGGKLDTGVFWNTGPNIGQPVSYFELAGGTAWTDAGIFLFGLALFVEAIAMLLVGLGKGPRVPILFFAISVTFVAAFLNLGVSLYLLSLGITPLFSLLAFGFGVYLLIVQWGWLKQSMAMVAR